MPDECPQIDCCLPSPFSYGDCSGVTLDIQIDPSGSGTATGAGRYQVGDEVEVCATPALPVDVDVGVDLVFVVDESGSMADARNILADVVTGLEARLNAAGIGSATVKNRYASVAFGNGDPAQQELAFQTSTTFVPAAATIGLTGIGALEEDAYEGIDFAITQMAWRETSAVTKLIFFITDEDRNQHYYTDGADQAAQFTSLKAKIISGGFLLAGMFQSGDGSLVNGDNEVMIASDYTGKCYKADGFGGYTESTGAIDNVIVFSFGDTGTFPTGQKDEYYDLVTDASVRGYFFDLRRYRNGVPTRPEYDIARDTWDDSVIAVIVPAMADRIVQELATLFVGWYDILGNLLSTESCYTFTIQSNTTLVAVFMQSYPMNLYYTLDGSTPTSASTPYTGPISLTEGQQFKIIAINGPVESDVALANAPDPTDTLVFDNATIGNGGGFPFDVHDSVDITDVEFNRLVEISDSQTATFATCANLATASFAALTTLNTGTTLDLSGCPALTSFSAPLLATIGASASFNLGNCTLLASVDLSALATIGASATFDLSENPALVTATMGNFTVANNATLNFSIGAFNQAFVDFILARCVASAGFVSGGVDLSGGTTSAPSVAGAADAATLTGRGVTVATN